MMRVAKRHDPLVADLSPQCARLSKAQMVGVARPAPAHEAWLCRDEVQVVLVANAPRLGQSQRRLVDRRRAIDGRSRRRLIAIVLGVIQPLAKEGGQQIGEVLALVVHQLRQVTACAPGTSPPPAPPPTPRPCARSHGPRPGSRRRRRRPLGGPRSRTGRTPARDRPPRARAGAARARSEPPRGTPPRARSSCRASRR